MAMELITRIFTEIIFELVAYNTGYYVWLIVPTKIRIEPLIKQKKRHKQKAFSFTYNRNNTSYLFHDYFALFGLLVWFIVGAVAYAIFRVNF